MERRVIGPGLADGPPVKKLPDELAGGRVIAGLDGGGGDSFSAIDF